MNLHVVFLFLGGRITISILVHWKSNVFNTHYYHLWNSLKWRSNSNRIKKNPNCVGNIMFLKTLHCTKTVWQCYQNTLSLALCANCFLQESAPTVQCTVYKQIEHVFALQKLPELQASSHQTQVFLLAKSSSSSLSMTNKAKPWVLPKEGATRGSKRESPSCRHMLPSPISGGRVGKTEPKSLQHQKRSVMASMGKQTKVQKHLIAILHLDCAGCNVNGQPHANNNPSAQTLCQTNLQINNEYVHVCLHPTHGRIQVCLQPEINTTFNFSNFLYVLCSWAPKGLQYISTMPNHEMQSNNSNSALNLRSSNGKTFSDSQLPLTSCFVMSGPSRIRNTEIQNKQNTEIACFHPHSTLKRAKCNCANQVWSS